MDKSSQASNRTDLLFADLQSGKAKRLADKVYENLFHAIVTGMITAGSRLPSENALAKEFDVSRPVLREALDRLRENGLVTSVRGSGNYVQNAVEAQAEAERDSDADRDTLERVGDLLSGIELRLIIEPEAAYLAAKRRGPSDLQRMRAALDRYAEAVEQNAILHHHDYAFHEAIAMATYNERIVETLKLLEYDVTRSVTLMRFLVQFQPLVRTEAVQGEHEEIFRHIEAGAAKQAQRAMRNHIEHARIRMMSTRPAL